MCTVSWVHSADGYQLLCNRDEKRTRRVARMPRVAEREGVRYIAPVDGDFGGTWLSANEHGVTLCLLNGHPSAMRGTQSRGFLVMQLSGARSAPEAVCLATASDLRLFSPFTLVALEPGRPAIVLDWDGESRRVQPDADDRVPLASSSYDPDGVRCHRQTEFRGLARFDAATLFQFHQSHGDGRHGDAYSACMHREDAETVSFSWVTVGPEAVEFFYTPAAPCRWAPGVTEHLKRRA